LATRRKRRAADADLDFDWLLAPYDAVMGGLRAAWASLKAERSTQLFVLLFFFALFFRLLRPDWYSNRLFHPDERWIFDKTAELSYPGEPGKTDGAGLQYGSLPMYVVATAKDVMHFVMKRGAHEAAVVAGRSITGVVDSLTVLGTFLLALQLVGAWPALLAARRKVPSTVRLSTTPVMLRPATTAASCAPRFMTKCITSLAVATTYMGRLPYCRPAPSVLPGSPG
jgi:hypothetical protein